jgi:hypothetical protein
MSRSQVVLRTGLVVASLGVLVLTIVASPAPVLVAAVVLVVLTGCAAWRPESSLVAVLVAGHVLHWVVAVPLRAGLAPWVQLLAAALLLLVVHLTASLAASLPPAAPVPTPTVRRWVRRGGVVAALTVPVWAVAALAAQQEGLGEVGLTYAAIAAVAVLTLAVWLLSREDTPRSR